MVGHAEHSPSGAVSSPTGQSDSQSKRTALLAAGGVLGAIGASTCCIIPLAFISLGMGGAWLGNIIALAPYQPIFIAIALACLVSGFYFIYRRPKAETCEADSACSQANSARLTKTALWVGTVLVVAAIAYPRVAPLFIEF